MGAKTEELTHKVYHKQVSGWWRANEVDRKKRVHLALEIRILVDQREKIVKKATYQNCVENKKHKQAVLK